FGFGALCVFGQECDGFSACPNGAPCGPSQCNNNPALCAPDPYACKGVENCLTGRCHLDGMPGVDFATCERVDGKPKDGTQCFGKAEVCGGDPSCAGDPKWAKGRCLPEFYSTPCSVAPQCTDAECKPMTCLTAGPGDADAYCTKHDCKSDADCPGGYTCGITR